MKKPAAALLILVTCVFVFFAAGLFLGRNLNRAPVRITAPSRAVSESADAVNINTATAEELEALPGIGPVLAQRILEYREASGSFRAVEELTKVEGLGTKTLEEIWDLITVGG